MPTVLPDHRLLVGPVREKLRDCAPLLRELGCKETDPRLRLVAQVIVVDCALDTEVLRRSYKSRATAKVAAPSAEETFRAKVVELCAERQRLAELLLLAGSDAVHDTREWPDALMLRRVSPAQRRALAAAVADAWKTTRTRPRHAVVADLERDLLEVDRRLQLLFESRVSHTSRTRVFKTRPGLDGAVAWCEALGNMTAKARDLVSQESWSGVEKAASQLVGALADALWKDLADRALHGALVERLMPVLLREFQLTSARSAYVAVGWVAHLLGALPLPADAKPDGYPAQRQKVRKFLAGRVRGWERERQPGRRHRPTAAKR